MEINLKKITGNWILGFALNKHTINSIPIGSNEQGHMQFDTTRSDVGESLFQLKYRNDYSQIQLLADKITEHAIPNFNNIDLVLPVPATQQRRKQPVYELAKAVAKNINSKYFENIIQINQSNNLQTLKNLTLKTEKEEALKNRFMINDEITNHGKWNALLLDDIYHTGATLEAACATLSTYSKIHKIYVSTLTWR